MLIVSSAVWEGNDIVNKIVYTLHTNVPQSILQNICLATTSTRSTLCSACSSGV